MNQLTKQDVALLMEAMERWETPDLARIASEVFGFPHQFGSVIEMIDHANSRKTELEARVKAELELRKERSVCVRAKLIQMRDSIVAGEFLNAAQQSSNPGPV